MTLPMAIMFAIIGVKIQAGFWYWFLYILTGICWAFGGSK